jgi:hypothetical protein
MVNKIDQHFPFQDTPKYTQIGILYENKPSGNPAQKRQSANSA